MPHKAVQLCGQLNVRFWCFVFVLRCLIYKVHIALGFPSSGESYLSTTRFACQPLFSSFFKLVCRSLLFGTVVRDSLVIIPPHPRNVNPLFQVFSKKFEKRGFLSDQVFFSKVAPHWRQVTFTIPFPLGTRSFWPQEGHLKILYCLFCSALPCQVPHLFRTPAVLARKC